MKKRLKKWSALLLAAVMMFSMAVTAGAAENVQDDLSATLTVYGLEDGLTVTGYKIVEAVVDDSTGIFTGYQPVDALGNDADSETGRFTGMIEDVYAPTSDEITAIAAQIISGKLKLDTIHFTQSTGSSVYTSTVTEAGTWLVLVTGSTDVSTVYNPMIVSAYYADKDADDVYDSLGTDDVSAGGNWNLTGDAYNEAYAKSSSPEFEKTIVASGSDNTHGDDAAIGDIITYQIKTNFPSYDSTYYSEVSFVITDTMDAGISYADGNNLWIYVNGMQVDNKSAYVTIDAPAANQSGGTLTISFDSDYVLANPGAEVIVIFDAYLNEDAGVNYDPNINTAAVTYTNGYETDEEGNYLLDEDGNPVPTEYEDDDQTYHYTFGIDASLAGGASVPWEEETYIKYTHEIIKVDGTEISSEEELEFVETESGIYTYSSALEGAVFQLFAENQSTVVATATTDENGYLSFTGLDAGTYYLQETKAASGYALDSTMHKVVIYAKYDNDTSSEYYGRLIEYSIEIDGNHTSTYTAEYKEVTDEDTEETEVVTTIEIGETTTVAVVNYKMGALPSTGGIGTTIFTIAGCVIMIAAAGIFFATRKKEQEN